MTAPNQPFPEGLAKLLGQGAYQIGGTENYGQGIDEDFVNSLVYGPIKGGNFDLMESVEDATAYLESFLQSLPLDILKFTQPFIAGATDDDYIDQATAAAFITNALVPKSVVNTLQWFTRLVLDLTILFDVLHITYPAGDPDDDPGTQTWYGAWNDLMELMGFVGTNPGDPAPSWGDAVADAKSKWDSLMVQLAALPGLILGGGGVSPAEWATWWSTVLVDIGIGGTDAANIANWLSGNYDAAKQAKEWWDDFLSSLGLGSGTDAGDTLANQRDWWSRFIEDELILSDLLHVYYPAGSPSDTPTTTSGGKRTWYSASADLKQLFADNKGISAPVAPSPIGDTVTTLGGTVTTQGSSITTQQAWWNRLAEDLWIQADLFHAYYPAGSPSDTATFTIGGRRTWYSAQADLKLLFTAIGQTPPAVTPTDIGASVNAGAQNHQALVDAVTSASAGAPQTGTVAADAAAALGGLQNTVTSLSSAVQSLQTNEGGTSQSGVSYAIHFNDYPNGAWPSSDWPVSYSGSGTSTLAISGGNAVLQAGTGGDVTALARYVSPTLTDYQSFSATIAGLPQGAAKNYVCVRANAAMDTYVYAGVYLSGFSLNWELGYYISGVQHVLATGTGAPLNFSFELRAGVGGNPYRFQGVSGNTVVFDFTDSTHSSQVGALYRYFGFKSITDNSGAYTPAPGSFVGCNDTAPVALVGSGFHMFHSSATLVTQTNTSDTALHFDNNWFDTNTGQTPDFTNLLLVGGPPTSVPFKRVTKAGWYNFDLRCNMHFAVSTAMMTVNAGFERYNAAGTKVETRLLPGIGAAFNVVGAQSYTSHFGGSGRIYCQAGDYVYPIYYLDGPGTASTLQFLGDPNGLFTYWSMSLANWSLS